MNLHVQLLATALLFTVCLSIPGAYGEQDYSVSSTKIVVFRNGVVLVKQYIDVDETATSISLTLLSSLVEHVLVLDQADKPMGYDFVPPDVTIYTQGVSEISLEYSTSGLTNKDGDVWTLKVNSASETTIALPDGSTIVYLSDRPSSVVAEGNIVVLTVGSGSWEVSYVTPLPTVTTTTTKTTSTQTSTMTETTTWTTTTPVTTTSTKTVTEITTSQTEPTETVPLPLGIVISVVIASIGVVIVLYLIRSRRTEPAALELTPEDRKVLQFIAEKGGRILELELREKLIIPKTSTWRWVKKLERMGYVRIRKVGVQNEIELVNTDR